MKELYNTSAFLRCLDIIMTTLVFSCPLFASIQLTDFVYSENEKKKYKYILFLKKQSIYMKRKSINHSNKNFKP